MNRLVTSIICLPILFSVVQGCKRQEDNVASNSDHTPAANAPTVLAESADNSASSETNAELRQKTAPLMQALFGKDYQPAHNNALTVLVDLHDRTKKALYVVNPVATTVLDNGQTVLVANAIMADDGGQTTSAHASSGLLNVYFLRQDGEQWTVTKRHENIASLGSFGHIGEVLWLKLAADKPGLGILHGGTWQGYSITSLSLFDLTAASMHDLTQNAIDVHSDNDGGCSPDTTECWNITGKWQFVSGKPGAIYDDLQLEFSGDKSRIPVQKQFEEGPDAKRVWSKVQASARYAFDGKHYRLISGENIIPGI